MPTKAELAAQNEALRNDLAIIAERIRVEAVDREWCDDYDQIMGEINGQTSEAHMKPCKVEVEVKVQGSIEVPFSVLSVVVHKYDGEEPDLADVEEAVHEWFLSYVSSEHYALDEPLLDSVTIETSEEV